MRRRNRVTSDPEATLFSLTEKMASQGTPLIPRVVPPEADFRQWDHYPAGDAVSRSTAARWFYHAHPPEQRATDEHGHFHLFLPLSAFEGIAPLANAKPKAGRKKSPAQVVHFAALAFDTRGLPTRWFTVNRWVTNEYLMPADSIIERLEQFDVTDAPGDPLVNGWLTAAVSLHRSEIAKLLRLRDEALEDCGYEDRGREILSSTRFEI